jgi:hypothetical protein
MLMSLTRQNVNDVLEKIAASRFAKDAKFLARQVLLCAQFRPNGGTLYCDFTELLSAEVPTVRSELLSPFVSEKVKYFPLLSFYQSCLLSGFFAAAEIVSRIADFVKDFPNDLVPRVYLFCYFAPVI